MKKPREENRESEPREITNRDPRVETERDNRE